MIAALVLLAGLAGDIRDVAPVDPDERLLSPMEVLAKRALDDCNEDADHLEVDLAEARADRDEYRRRLDAMIATPPPPAPEPETPEWVPYAIVGGVALGAVLGAVGTIAVLDAVNGP